MKKILVTGGLGYIGIELANTLAKKYKVIVYDLALFGIPKKVDKRIKIFKKNFNSIKKKDLKNIDTVIHLASISNDPAVELNPQISWENNVLFTYQLLDQCKKAKIKKFIFASSGSVYGIKKEKQVTEELDLLPVSEYNKTKMVGERLVLSYSKYFTTTIIRPATVCGFSNSMRLDVSVNILTYHALSKSKITILGGKQFRPNVHIKDMIRAYEFFVKKDKFGVFNLGFENLKIESIAKLIENNLNKKITVIRKKTKDVRSYRLDSSKLIKIGFKPKFKVIDAIKEITEAYNSKIINNKKNYYRINFLKAKLANKNEF